MTTYQLASLLEHLQLAFGENLKAPASGSLAEAVAAFRELPDQNLRALLTSVRRANTTQPATTGGNEATHSPPVAVAGVVERIRAIRDGTASIGEMTDLSKLKKDQLKEVLREFKQPVSGTNPELLSRIRQLCVKVEQTPPPLMHSSQVDTRVVEVGVALYQKLVNDRELSIPDVRAGFAPLREYSKPVLEEISRQVGYTPAGSRDDILDRLLNNLEGIKMNQHRYDRILTGTSS